MKKFIKNVKVVAVILLVGAAAVYALSTFAPTEVYVAPEPEPVVEEAPTDNVSEAQKQLNEAKRLLDNEEKMLLAEIQEKESRIEEIRQVRLSFSQAPTPAQ
jgi:hypothetical protein